MPNPWEQKWDVVSAAPPPDAKDKKPWEKDWQVEGDKSTPAVDTSGDRGWTIKAGHGPRQAFGVTLPSWTEPIFRVGGSIVGDMKGDTAIGRALGFTTEVTPEGRAPLLNFSNLGAEDIVPLKDTTAGKIARGAITGTQDFATGLTTPENLLLLAGTGGVGAIAKKLGQTAISKALSATFGVDMVTKAIEQSPEFAAAVAAGDTEKATNILTQIAGGAAMGAAAIKHAAVGTGGRADSSKRPSVESSEAAVRYMKSERNPLTTKWVDAQMQNAAPVTTTAKPKLLPKAAAARNVKEYASKEQVLLAQQKAFEEVGLALRETEKANQLGLPPVEAIPNPFAADVARAFQPPTPPPPAPVKVPKLPLKPKASQARNVLDYKAKEQAMMERARREGALTNRTEYGATQLPPMEGVDNTAIARLIESQRNPSSPARPTPGAPLTPRQADAHAAFTSNQPILPREMADLYSPNAATAALAAAESISRPIDIRAQTTPITRTPKSAETSLDTQTNPSQVKGESTTGMVERRKAMDTRLKKAVMRGDKTAIQRIIEAQESGNLSSLGGEVLDRAANRAWSWAKGKFSPGVSTPIRGGKLNYLQQAAADNAKRVADAKKAGKGTFGLTPPDVNASAWQRGMWRMNRIAHAGGVYLDDALRGTQQTLNKSIKAGETYSGRLIGELLDSAINAHAIAAEKLTKIGFNRIADELDVRGGHEAAEYAMAPHLKTLEIRGAGNRLFEAALSDKASTYHPEVSALDAAYQKAKSELAKLGDESSAADPIAYESAVENYHMSQAAMDQWKIANGQSFWNTLLESGERGPRTGRTAAEIEGYLTDPEFKIYEPYRKVVRDGFDMVEKEAVDAGLIPQKLLDRMKQLYPDYFQLSRIGEGGLYSGGAVMGTRSVGHLPAQSGFKKFKVNESESPIDDIFTSLYNKATGTIAEANRNRVGNELFKFLTETGADGNVGRMGWRDVMRVVDPKEIKSGDFTPSSTNSISFLQNGRKRYIEINDPLITAGLRNINPNQAHGLILATIRNSARMFRVGQTGVNLEFFSRNLPVDIQQSFHTSPAKVRTTLKYLLPITKSFYSTLKQTILGRGEDRSAMTLAGSGFNENILYQSPADFSSSMAHMYSKPGRLFGEAVQLPKRIANDPVGVLAATPGTMLKGGVQTVRLLESGLIKSEEFSRLRAFKSVKEEIMQPGGADRKFFGTGKSLAERYGLKPEEVARGLDETTANSVAAQEANNVLPPYHRSGLLMRHFSPFMPYLNASQKAITSTLRRAADNPVKFATVWTVGVGLPTIAATAWNLQDERMAALNFELAEFEKDRSVIRLLPLPADGESYEQYKARVTKENGKFSTYNFPLVPGVIGEAQITLRRALEQVYKEAPAETVAYMNSMVGSDPITPPKDGSDTPVPSVRPLTAAEFMTERVGRSLLPFELSPGGLASATVPPMFRGLAENYVDKDFYTERPITSPTLDRLSGVPERQFSTGRQTSPLMVDAAAMLGPSIGIPTLAPQHLENILFKQFGTAGRHALNFADAVAGYPPESRGGRDPFEGVADIFTSSTGGEQERIEAETKGEDDIKSRRSLYLNIATPQLQFSQKTAGYMPSLPKRKQIEEEQEVNGKTVKRTTYIEPEPLYQSRLQLRGLMITDAFAKVMDAVDLKKWNAKPRDWKKERLTTRVENIDAELNDLYIDSLTDDQRLAIINERIAEYKSSVK